MFIRFTKVFSGFVRKILFNKYQDSTFATLFTPSIKNRIESRNKKIGIDL